MQTLLSLRATKQYTGSGNQEDEFERKGPATAFQVRDLAFMSDEDVLLCLQSGQADVFSQLMARYQRLVYQIAHRILRDHGEAEDMVQHVFLEIYRYHADFDPARGTVRTWLLQCAYTRSIERLKYLHRRRFYHHGALTEINHQTGVIECPSSTIESRQLVSLALEELNEPQRQVIRLSHFEGHSLLEIAEQIGQSYAQVRHHFYRGLKKMRVALEVKTQAGPLRHRRSVGLCK